MNHTLYLECLSGISGDMTVAALLDLGADEAVLKSVIESLPLEGFHVNISRVIKSGIDACDFDVHLDAAHENHDHDMEYLHGAHHHHHEHHHTHEHRGMPEIRQIIEAGDMTDGARKLALHIFTILAEAESKAHHLPVDEVHFHEVGAVDSIVDIVAVAVCIDNLQIKEVVVPKLCEGTGMIRCQHGMLPVPVPAVANIMEAYHLPLQIIDIEGEFVTPTGAAIVAALMTDEKLPEQFRVVKTGIGAGKREYERPSMLRAMIVESIQTEQEDVIYKLESNIDDCSGEVLGYTMEKLLAAGARDVHYTPVYMKKNRPGWLLTVICSKQKVDALERMIFHETTTIGIRRFKVERSVLQRSQVTVQTELGEAVLKVCELDGERRYYPEYDSVVKLCETSGRSYGDVYQMLSRTEITHSSK